MDTLLSMQNPNGGFCSYELQRGSEKMEWLNAAEVFGESQSRPERSHASHPLSRVNYRGREMLRDGADV